MAKSRNARNDVALHNAGVVSRMSALLWALADGAEPHTVHEIAANAGLPASTTHRLLNQMQREGLVAQTADRRYLAGNSLLSLGAAVLNRAPTLFAARQVIESVIAQTGKGCLLSLYLPHRLGRVLAAEVPAPGMPVSFGFSDHRDLVWGSTGRAILAFLPEPDVAQAIRIAPPSPADGRKPPPAPVIADALRRIRASRYAVSSGEVQREGTALAVPLFGSRHQILGSIAVTESNCRWNARIQQHLADVLLQCSTRAGAALG